MDPEMICWASIMEAPLLSASLLDRIHHWTDLPALIESLGHEPGWEPIPPTCWPPRSRLAGPDIQTARIGQVGDLPWIGLAGTGADALARAAARTLQRRGDPAAIAAFDPATGGVCLTVAFGSRPVLHLAPGPIDGCTRESLERLGRVHRDGRLATAAQIALALAGEGLGARFFSAFRHQLERIAEGIGDRFRPEDRRVLALLQLNRLLFLYFIQSRGWLDGRTDFLRSEADRCLARKGRLHQHLLKPLFFGTLNQRPDRRSPAARRLGQVPFLNGGLFEPHLLERAWRGSIPNPVLRDVFDELFERFHFSVQEGSTGAIAPDMLGRVFEGLMAPDERGRSGSFYTPPGLVRSVIDQCLVALVSGRLACDEAAAERMLAGRDRRVEPILRKITVLDPAAGSGAFLLGTLDRLVELRSGSPGGGHRLQREILRRNLFGVDINPTAVRLTELRLWLAVIAADPAESGGSVNPLPNLDCLVRQGDSLADPLNLITRFPFRAGAMGAMLARLRGALVVATGDDKRDAARRLRRGEVQAMGECLDYAERCTDRGIRECLATARAGDLFGNARGLDRVLCRELSQWRSWRTRVRRARQRLVRDGEVSWFQYESHFADVFAAGGFDAIVGNPPWVRAEQVPLAVREQLAGRYRWWRPATQSRGFRHQPDLAVAFLERATELARPGGVVGMLLPAKLATAAYGAAARHDLCRDFSLGSISDLGADGDQFDATVYPMALIARKSPPAPDHHLTIRYPGGECRIPQAEFGAAPVWALQAPDAVAIARGLAARFPAVKDRFLIHLGVKTGANQVFLDPPDSVEPDLVRRAVRGRDIRRFAVAGGVNLLWPCGTNGDPLQRLPSGASEYLRSAEPRLRARADYREGPWWSLFRTAAAVSRYRVIWSDLARRLTAVALTTEADRRNIPLNSCYLIAAASDLTAHALAAWFNSTWIGGLARLAADPARGGYARFNARAVGGVPLPDAVIEDNELAVAGRHRRQDHVDELAATHLQLGPEAKKILAGVAGAGPDPRR